MDKAMGDILGCYAYEAAAYGAAKCDPPPMLLSAVRGKCSQEEGALRSLFLKMAPAQSELARTQIADIAMERVARKYDPIIQSWLLDSQIKAGGCQRPGTK